MPVWVWILLGLAAVGFAFWVRANRVELGVEERSAQAVAIFIILAIVAALVIGLFLKEWN